MMRKTCLILMLAILGTFGLQSQEKLSLDLAAARKYALEYNKVLAGSGYAVDKARMELREAIANGLPQVGASMEYTNALGASLSIRFNENLPATEIDIKPTANAYINVNQLIFSGNYIVGVQMARLSKSLSEIQYRKSELEVISQVSNAYYLAQMAREMRALLERNLLNLQDLYRKTAAMEYAGVIEQTDVDQLSVQVMTMENALASARRQEELTLNLLRLHLGADPETGLELTDSLSGLLAPRMAGAFSQPEFTPDRNLDYQLLKQQELLVARSVNMQRANALPTLSSFYRYTYQFIEPDFNMTPANMVGLQMNIPIFSSGLRSAQTRKALIDLRSTRNQKDLLTDQLMMQDKQLRFDLLNAMETYTNQQRSVEVSRRVYQSLKLKYEQGMISGLDLITADNNYLRAETDYITAILDVLDAQLQLEKLHGTIQ